MFEMLMLREICGKIHRDKNRNERRTRGHLEIVPVVDMIREK